MFVSVAPGGTLKRARAAIIAYMFGLAPSILLVEAGIAGYLGFVSFMRYVSMAAAIIESLG